MTKAEQARIVAWRLKILQHAATEHRHVAQTCRYFGISRTAFYRWKKRFDEHGEAGLADRPRTPHRSPRATSPAVVSKILYLRQNAIGYDAPDRTVHVRNELDGSLYQIEADPLFAADGAGSRIRRSFDGTGTFGGVENLLAHGYKELSIPAGPGGQYQLAPDALHIWPRGGFMLIALPNPGGDFTLTLFLPTTGENSFEELTGEKSVVTFFEKYFPDAAELIPNLTAEMLNNSLGVLGTVRCRHWHDRGNVLLLGDAAHAIVPFHGQGMNLAFEDCVLPDRIVREIGSDWPNVFARFEAEQLANANAIVDIDAASTTAARRLPPIDSIRNDLSVRRS